jgi:hypothetical protein
MNNFSTSGLINLELILSWNYTSGLINLDTMARFNQAKNFKMTKNFTLAREFFKHLGHFTLEDLKVFVQHMLGKTTDQLLSYPKVTVHKSSKVHWSHYSSAVMGGP